MNKEIENGNPEADKKDISELIEDSTWKSNPKVKQSRKKDEEEYIRRFLGVHKVKDYTPVYIDVQMKEKLQALVKSVHHNNPEITPTILLSNILADHLSVNQELITRVANDGLKRSLATTFNDKKE